VFGLKHRRDEIQSRIDDIAESLQHLQDDLDRQTAALEETTHLRGDQELELKAKEDLIGRARAKMAAVNNSKQFMAAEREVESARKDMTMVEEQVVQLLDTEEKGKADLAERQVKLDTLKSEMSAKVNELSSDIKKLDKQLKKSTVGRDSLVEVIDRQLRARYDMIAGRLNGAAMAAAIDDGTCSGCNMQVRPLVYNQLHRADSLHMCAHCKRILFLESWLEGDEPVTPAAPSEAEPSKVVAEA
jgi:hypothetical protein